MTVFEALRRKVQAKLAPPPVREESGIIVSSGRTANYAVVRTARGVIEVVNTALPSRPGLPVRVRYENGCWQVIGLDHVELPELGDYHYVPHHGRAHEFNRRGGGDDVIWIDKRQYTPFLVAPTEPPSLFVRIFPGTFFGPDGFHQFGEFTLNLSDLYSGTVQRALIYLDTLRAEIGAEIVGPVFSIEPGRVPLAVVYLRPGATRIHWDDIRDIRDIPPTLPVAQSAQVMLVRRVSGDDTFTYPCSADGVALALEEAAPGDIILLPVPIHSIGTVTVPAGVTVDFCWSEVTVSGDGVALRYVEE